MGAGGMRAFVLEEYGRIEEREFEEPRGEGVQVRVVCCGVCGSDVAVYLGKPGMRERWRPPLILGHEVGGVVEDGLEKGRAVAVNPLIECGQCDQCAGGRENLCRNRTHVGFHIPGGFAERLRVPERQLVPLPKGVEAWKGALAEPLAVAVHAAQRAGDVRGRRVLVVGGGGIGAFVAWVLRRSGGKVAVVEANEKRRLWLEELGVADVAGEAEGEFEVVVDSAGTGGSVDMCLSRCAPGGRVVVVGLGASEARLRLDHLVLGEVALEGSYTYTRRVFEAAVGLLEELPDWPWERRPAKGAEEALRDLAAGRVAAGRVLLTW